MARVTKEDLQIDLLNLEGEWQAQPNLYMEAAEQSSRARQALDEIEATLYLQAKNDPEVKDILGGKITDAGIKHWTALQPEYKEAFLAKNEADGLVKSFDQKKAALENEVRLWAGQYFSGPKEPKEVDQAVSKKIAEKRTEGQRSKVTRTRRKK